MIITRTKQTAFVHTLGIKDMSGSFKEVGGFKRWILKKEGAMKI